MSFKVLQGKIDAKNNPTVMGLDPKLEYVPEHIISEVTGEFGKTPKAAGEAIFRFNKGLIDACYDLVPAVKPQSAYYEMYGLEGLGALCRTVDYARSKGLYVILDAKRGDIGATCEAYSSAYLGGSMVFGERAGFLDCDCLTVNPYLGRDGVQPFIDDCVKFGKSIFVLVKTSNKSSGDFQDMKLAGGGTLYEHVARELISWGEPDNIGAVVGATYSEQLADLRGLMPRSFLLVPGFGAQGGAAADIRRAFDRNGGGAVVNSSRAIMCAWQGKPGAGLNFGECARDEVIRMRDALNEVRP